MIHATATGHRVVELNNNAGWCWFQDPRVLVDQARGRLICATVASEDGPGGEQRVGGIEVTSLSWPDGPLATSRLSRFLTRGECDDHNCAALVWRPDGRLLAVYTGHNYGTGNHHTPTGAETEPRTYYRISTQPDDLTAWDDERSHAWPIKDRVGLGMTGVTYSNLHHLSAEGGPRGRIYNFARATGQLWQIAISDDEGQTWDVKGPVTLPPPGGRAYSNGYMKFCDNGVDRIDFITTEAHPRDYNNGVYHGYIQGGQTFNAAGERIDPDTFGHEAPQPERFTSLFTPQDVAADTYHHAWTAEIRRGPQNQLFALFATRFGLEEMEKVRWTAPGIGDHRLFFAHFNGSTWSEAQEMCRMGPGLNWYQEDYTGLATVDPRNGLSVYVSTPIDPRSGERLAHHEIFRARREHHEGAWHWSPITQGSSADNLRPWLAVLDEKRAVLLWLHGDYPHPHHYTQSLLAAEVD